MKISVYIAELEKKIRKARAKNAKSHTGILSIKRLLNAIISPKVPFPVTFSQIRCFLLIFFLVMMFGDTYPLSLVDNVLFKNIALPMVVAWIVGRKAEEVQE